MCDHAVKMDEEPVGSQKFRDGEVLLKQAAGLAAEAEAEGHLESLEALNRATGLVTQNLRNTGADPTVAQKVARRACYEICVRRGLTARPLLFFSQSKDADDLELGLPSWRKLLSNFANVPNPEEAPIVCNGNRRYPSVEAAFQAAKFLFSASPEPVSFTRALDFEVGGPLGAVGVDPVEVKKAGARKGMGMAGCALDVGKWNQIADGVMIEALVGRWRVDHLFRSVLLECKRAGVQLVHFERAGAKSYWGGAIRKEDGVAVGRNRLGQMLEALRDSPPDVGK